MTHPILAGIFPEGEVRPPPTQSASSVPRLHIRLVERDRVVYSTCIFCHESLGRNEAIEHLPLGRRLAYDPSKGRVWVVCRGCQRWNLSPLETRWEAIEEAERAFRTTPLRASTANIGLARLREGLELVRIGEPPPIELAGWRYGDQFKRRRRRNVLLFSGGAVAALIPSLASFAGLAIAGAVVGTGKLAYDVWNVRRATRRVVSVIRCDDGSTVDLTRRCFLNHSLEPRWDGDGWRLHICYRTRRAPDGSRMPPDPNARIRWSEGMVALARWSDGMVTLSGEEARRVLAIMLPMYNAFSGRSKVINDAVDIIGASRSLDHMMHTQLAALFGNLVTDRGGLNKLPASARLALEMVLHNDDERRALDGDMHLLEARWRDAEVVAAIADGLLLPSDMDARVEALKATGDRGAAG